MVSIFYLLGRLQGLGEKVNGTKDAFPVQLALLIYIILDIGDVAVG